MIPKVPWLTRTTLRPFRLFMLSSASAVVLPYPHSRWKVIHLLCLSFIFYLLGPEKYTVTIHLNENHLVVIITLHRQTLHLELFVRSSFFLNDVWKNLIKNMYVPISITRNYCWFEKTFFLKNRPQILEHNK